ncbi:MAG: peptidase [Gemmatimonadota bacterium]|nr:peptidase [Gemmatimonadota bacterium]
MSGPGVRFASFAAFVGIGIVAGLGACSDRAPADSDEAGPPELTEAEARTAQFSPVELTFDASLLDDRQKQVVRHLVEASRELDMVFRLQKWAGNGNPNAVLPAATGREASATRDYYEIMYGPWDNLDEDEPFLDVGPRPPGAGYYPEDLTVDEFETWVAEHPGDEEAFRSLYTIIRRTDSGLQAIPYSQAYREPLGRASASLAEAARFADNPSLKQFLRSRSRALLTDEYYDSEVAWMRLTDNLIDPTIGPYEVYEDQLFGYKTAFESFIGLKDPAASELLASLAAELPALEAALPIADEYKYLDRPFTSPISVIDLIYGAGDARQGVQTIAFNLPNDPRVRQNEGSKKVMLRNVIQAKFDRILKPIAAAVLVPEQAGRIGFEAYFTRVLMHELSHALGPDYVTGRPNLTVNQGLRDRYSAIEEAKADATGTHSLAVLTERGVYDADFQQEIYIDHVADMFRCVRFGATEAHGLGCLTQFNYLVEHGAIEYVDETERFRANFERMPEVMAELAAVYLMFEATADYDGAGAFLESYGRMSRHMRDALDRLDGTVPVDLRPSYAVEDLLAEWQ